jgi:hypothetical protein
MDIQQQLQEYANQGYSRTRIAKSLNKSKRWVDWQLRRYNICTHAKPGLPGNSENENKKCVICGTDLKKNAKRFCSCHCSAQDRWNQRKLRIEQEQFVKDSRHGRRFLIERDGNKCTLCGNTTWMEKPIPLVMDHIDGNPENNALENLRMICCNCDALTPTYKNRNRGNGRHSRRTRYREGKSY